MCFRVDHGTHLHKQSKFQPWPAKIQMVSDAELKSKKEAEKFLNEGNFGDGFFFVMEIFRPK